MRLLAGLLALALIVVVGGILILGAILTYGYFDGYASSRTSDEIHVTAHAASWWGVRTDSIDYTQPFHHGQIFIAIEWVQPAGKVLSKLRLTGSAWEGNTKLEDFDVLCQRNLRTDLRGTTVEGRGGVTFEKPNCFIKLKTTFPYAKEASGDISNEELSRVRARIDGVTLRDLSYSAEASNSPMRIVVWTEEFVGRIMDGLIWLAATISYPFARQ